MADDDTHEAEWNRPPDDDQAVLELLEGLERWNLEAAGAVPSRASAPVPFDDLAGVLLDVGDLSAGAATLVRAVVPYREGPALFAHEAERLEIPSEHVTARPIPWDLFHRAGGSAVVMVAAYWRTMPDGARHHRVLCLMASRHYLA